MTYSPSYMTMTHTEDDTFNRLKRTSYRTVWERCKVHVDSDDVNSRIINIRSAKKACGWTEEEFRIQWGKHGASWERLFDE